MPMRDANATLDRHPLGGDRGRGTERTQLIEKKKSFAQKRSQKEINLSLSIVD